VVVALAKRRQANGAATLPRARARRGSGRRAREGITAAAAAVGDDDEEVRGKTQESRR
jgi:hypothetical protein